MESYMPSHGNVDSSSLKIVLDNSDELYKIESFFRGAIQVEENSEIVWKQISGRKKMMNDEGIARFMGFLSSHANKVFSLSNFNQKEIDELTFDAVLEIILILGTEYRALEIEKCDRGIIKVLCANFIYASAKQPMDDKNREHLWTHHTSIENRDLSPGKKEAQFNPFGGQIHNGQ